MKRVVVTGMGVVSPIGTGIAAFHGGLRDGRQGIGAVQSFDASSFTTRIAGEVTDLDPNSVALPKHTAAALRRDTKALFGLVAAREAVESAFGSQSPSCWYRPERIGVVVSAGLEIFHLDDLAPYVIDDQVEARALMESLAQSAPGSRLQIPADIGAKCIRDEVGAEGMFSVNLSACAAGTQALGEAFWAIRDGRIDAAVSGGYDSMVNPLGLGGFALLRALSTANHLGGGASRPFDKSRDGFVLGEGAGMCVLEEYESARRRGAHIYGEVLGYASRLDAHHVSDPRPDTTGAMASMRTALDVAEIGPHEIDYINAHGTGTPKNDPAETAAIWGVFGGHADSLPVSSTKSQIGHLIGAAGAVEFLAVLFAINEHCIPATINFTEADPACDLDYVVNEPRQATVRTALSNSFGFGGQNASIIVGVLRS